MCVHMHPDPSSAKASRVKARREWDVRGQDGSGEFPSPAQGPGMGHREMWVWELQNTHTKLLALCCPVIP